MSLFILGLFSIFYFVTSSLGNAEIAEYHKNLLLFGALCFSGMGVLEHLNYLVKGNKSKFNIAFLIISILISGAIVWYFAKPIILKGV